MLGSRRVRLALNSAWMQSVLVILGVLMTIFLVDLGVHSAIPSQCTVHRVVTYFDR